MLRENATIEALSCSAGSTEVSELELLLKKSSSLLLPPPSPLLLLGDGNKTIPSRELVGVVGKECVIPDILLPGLFMLCLLLYPLWTLPSLFTPSIKLRNLTGDFFFAFAAGDMEGFCGVLDNLVGVLRVLQDSLGTSEDFGLLLGLFAPKRLHNFLEVLGVILEDFVGVLSTGDLLTFTGVRVRNRLLDGVLGNRTGVTEPGDLLTGVPGVPGSTCGVLLGVLVLTPSGVLLSTSGVVLSPSGVLLSLSGVLLSTSGVLILPDLSGVSGLSGFLVRTPAASSPETGGVPHVLTGEL